MEQTRGIEQQQRKKIIKQDDENEAKNKLFKFSLMEHKEWFNIRQTRYANQKIISSREGTKK